MIRLAGWPLAAAVLALGVVAAGCGQRIPAAKGDRLLGVTAPSEPVRFALVLRLRERALADFLAHLTARGRRRARPIDAVEFGRRFGPSTSELARLKWRLTEAGLHETAGYAQRTSFEVTGSARAVDALFETSLADFATPDGQRYHRPLRVPSIPADLARSVAGVSGLSTRPLLRAFDIPHAEGLTPGDVSAAYDLAPLHARGVRGQGQTVAILGIDASVSNSDLAAFDRRYRLVGPRVVHCLELVAGHARCGAADSPPDASEREQAAAQENALDVEVVRGVAPRAQILNWIVRFSNDVWLDRGLGSALADSVGRGIDEITQDGRAGIVSVSYGVCDVERTRDGSPWLSPADRLRGEHALQAAVATGIDVFVSSGDRGAYECQRDDLADQRPTVAWPEDSPWVTSVGGTLLSVRRDGSYLDESGWEDVLTEEGTGGGTNPHARRPIWQKAPGVPNGPRRAVPDVSAAADGDSGFAVVFGDGEPSSVGGTSAAAPFWAASTALVSQYVEARGQRLPFLNTVIYALASTRPAFPPFHDVVKGGNRRDDAGPGWDFATGLGSPDVYNLARDVADLLRRHR
jgi:kumamolisin